MRKLSMDELQRVTLSELQNITKNSFVVVLDNVRSMNNVGSAFRTTDAFLGEKIVLTGITACPPHREINKTALGATESVQWEYFENIAFALKALKKEGYLIAIVEQTDTAKLLTEVNLSNQKIAFVFGNEVEGVSEEALALADIAIEIPQYGTKHSLNISVTVGILLWEFVRQNTITQK
jgi:tRNA G18 (ribose-2'-O)-methylase SpoU